MEKADIKKTEKIIINAVTTKNGFNNIKYFDIPIEVVLLNYKHDENSKKHIRGENFAFWIRLENARFKKIERQLRSDLREISFWFVGEEIVKLRNFLNSINI